MNRVVLFIVSGNSRIMQTFADRVIEFNRGLVYRGNLPDDFQVMNPFLDNPETMVVMSEFITNIIVTTGREGL